MCDAYKALAGNDYELVCDLPGVGHEWHWDGTDNVTWKEGEPDAADQG